MDRNLYQDSPSPWPVTPPRPTERSDDPPRGLAWHAAEASWSSPRGSLPTTSPELWRKNYSDEIELWIELGQPDESASRRRATALARWCLYTLRRPWHQRLVEAEPGQARSARQPERHRALRQPDPAAGGHGGAHHAAHLHHLRRPALGQQRQPGGHPGSRGADGTSGPRT